jgi:hypothetical protein
VTSPLKKYDEGSEMIQMKKTLISAAVAIVLAGCGGGGSFSSTPPPETASSGGRVVDGAVRQATVVCESFQANGIRDTPENSNATVSEVATITDDLGNFGTQARPQVDFSCVGSSIFATGGTNIDSNLPFVGVIKAPADSRYITPLTTLMADGMTATEVAIAMGLPADTDVTAVDPLENPVLRSATVAFQQVVQQITKSLGGLAQDSSPAAQNAIYSEVARSVVAVLKPANGSAIPLVRGGVVNTAQVKAVVIKSVDAVGTSTDAALSVTTKSKMRNFSGDSIAELTSVAISKQAETLYKASSVEDLVKSTKALQASNTITSAASAFKGLLTKTNASSVDLTKAGVSLSTIADSTSTAEAKNEAATEIEKNGQNEANKTSGDSKTDAPTMDRDAWAETTNVLSLVNDTIGLNGTAYTLTEFVEGVTLVQRPAPLDMVSFTYNVKGTPVPADANGIMTTSVSLGVAMTDTGTKGQVLQFILDRADVTVSADGKIGISVPTGALLYAYGKTSDGTEANVTLRNFSQDDFVAVDSENKLSFNAGKVLNKIAQDGTIFARLKNVKGTFNLTVVASDLNIAGQTQTSIKGLTVSVTDDRANAVRRSISGLGVQGIFTVE